MREIKFRAWHRPSHLMVQGVSHVQPDSYIVMQYTGLKDRHGVEIYEGDIVSIKGKTCEVFWNENEGAWKYTDRAFNPGLYKSDGVEVIGNIYENPELLK